MVFFAKYVKHRPIPAHPVMLPPRQQSSDLFHTAPVASNRISGGYVHVLPLIRLIITLTIISSHRACFGNQQGKATKALSAMRFRRRCYTKILPPKNQTKIAAAILLLPSVNEWFLTIKYSRLAAFSSMLG